MTLIERSYWEQLTDHHDASEDDKVWGAAYRIKPDKVAEVKDYLDIREINGYTIHYAPFHPATPTSTPSRTSPSPSSAPQSSSATAAGPIRTLVYIGTPDNEQFVGPQDPQALAEHIYRSEGPSGLNRDYLWGLERSLDELSPASGDEHITDLSDRVRAIAAADKNGLGLEPGLDKRQTDEQQPPHHEFRKVSSVDEQEETEKTS